MGAKAFNSIPVVYYNINDGKLKVKVDKDTPGAIKRVYVIPSDKNKEEHEVWELHYKSIEGYIYKMESRVVEKIGLVWKITLMDENPDEPLMVLNVTDGDNFCSDLFKKLPNVNFDDLVTLQPYKMPRKDKDGNEIKDKYNYGMTVIQEARKVENFFYDSENKKNINGFPEIQVKNPDSDDWKSYFITVKKFLRNYVVENIIPRLEDSPESERNQEQHNDEESFNNNLPTPDNKVEDDSLPF